MKNPFKNQSHEIEEKSYHFSYIVFADREVVDGQITFCDSVDLPKDEVTDFVERHLDETYGELIAVSLDRVTRCQ